MITARTVSDGVGAAARDEIGRRDPVDDRAQALLQRRRRLPPGELAKARRVAYQPVDLAVLGTHALLGRSDDELAPNELADEVHDVLHRDVVAGGDVER